MPDKLEDAYNAWNVNQSDDTLRGVLDAAEPVISAGLRSYGGVNVKDDPVLRLEAQNIVVSALPKYDPKQAKLNTYLMYNMKALARKTHQRAQELSIPQRAWYDMQNLNTVKDSFSLENDRPPSDTELADLSGLSTKRINYLKQLSSMGVPESVLREYSPDEYFAPTTEEQSDFWADAVYNSLGGRDQLIFDYRLGTHGQKQFSNQEIAKKLGITPAAVSQRVSKIILMIEQGRPNA